MLNQLKKQFVPILTVLLLAGFAVSCDLSSSYEEQEAATAIIAAEFVDADSGEELASATVSVAAAFDDADAIHEQGTVETDENGEFEVSISSVQETDITRVEFTVFMDQGSVTVGEDVHLPLTFEEPYERAEFYFEIEQESDQPDGEDD